MLPHCPHARPRLVAFVHCLFESQRHLYRTTGTLFSLIHHEAVTKVAQGPAEDDDEVIEKAAELYTANHPTEALNKAAEKVLSEKEECLRFIKNTNQRHNNIGLLWEAFNVQVACNFLA